VANDCIEYTNETSLHINEHGVAATFVNLRRKELRKVEYDRCYNRRAGRRQADYIIGFNMAIDVIVELKGSDLKHAVSQIEDTLEAWTIDPIRFPKIVCLIVYGHTFPKMTSRIGVMEREFELDHNTLLQIRPSGEKKFRFSALAGKSG
jgi:hypothetical protein